MGYDGEGKAKGIRNRNGMGVPGGREKVCVIGMGWERIGWGSPEGYVIGMGSKRKTEWNARAWKEVKRFT